MKKIFIISAIIAICSVSHGQGDPQQILAENNANEGKMVFTLSMEEFSDLDEEDLDGTYKLLYENGSISEIRSFEKGELDGTWVQYDQNQQIVAIANYKNNKKHGRWIIWDKNGMKRYEIEYEHGKRTGTWKSWDEDGNLVNTEIYK
mgnify:FL=1